MVLALVVCVICLFCLIYMWIINPIIQAKKQKEQESYAKTTALIVDAFRNNERIDIAAVVCRAFRH